VRHKYITIGSFDLAHNKIGDFGSISISELLQEKTALKSLNLEGNEITAKGALYIAKGLAKNKTLESLNLSSNSIGKAAPMTMSEREAAGMTKIETDYERNERNNAVVLPLAQALETNTTLKLLNLENNKIEDFGQQTLKESFYVNSLLRKHYGMEPLQVIGVEPSIFDREKETALQERVRQIIAKKDEADRRPSAGEVEVRAISAAEAATSLAAGATGITSRHN
jgi:Ran GTPase-activating protein (RanGAP) involved in mRNA processing and transport